MHDGLQARIHDPLWLLARQWQVGEFKGEDGGSPVSVRLRSEAARLTRYHPGPRNGSPVVEGQPYDGRRMPLEPLVERERVHRDPDVSPDAGAAAEAGLHFLRLLDAHGVGQHRTAYTAQYPLEAPQDAYPYDADSRRFLLVMGDRVPDGTRLYADLRAALYPPDETPGALPDLPPLPETDRAAVQRAAEAWLQWYEALFSEPDAAAPAWMPERMEYAFAVAAPTRHGEQVLAAPEYHGGHLDWYSFDVQPDASLGARLSDAAPREVVRTLIPTPVNYQGMPASRWWEFEDAQIDLGAIKAGPEDLGRLLLMEYALLYSDDWFVVPVELDVGSLCRIHSLVVTDSFGERVLIRPYHEVDGPGGPWRLFYTSLDRRAEGGNARPLDEYLFLPPALGESLESPPVEEVLFLRDEMANMAWGVERVVQNALGRPLRRFEAYQQQRQQAALNQPATPPDPTADLTYRLATRVPDYWIPLVPVPDGQGQGAMRLQRGRMLDVEAQAPVAIAPRGRILEPDRPLSLHEEEVPRSGARVTRAYQHTRWIDGSTVLWMGRRKQPGRGEGWSGLRFDAVETTRGS